MLAYAQNGQALTLGGWWWFAPPGAMIALLGMGLALINFAIDEVINPRLRTQHLHRAKKASGPARRAEEVVA
jgi:peptide/nickel transport system permease protein